MEKLEGEEGYSKHRTYLHEFPAILCSRFVLTRMLSIALGH